jgi:hypothetical protein
MMVSLRLLTWAAIVAGSCLGALAAVWREPPPTPEVAAVTLPVRPLAQIRRGEAAEVVGRMTEVSPPQSEASLPLERVVTKASTAAGPVRERPLPSTLSELEETTASCARGEDDDCLRAAEAYQTGRVGQADEKRARDFRSTAIRRYAVRCNRRDPDACHALSMLHARGFGLKQDAYAARALLERARLACRTRPAGICARL